ncbi:MAG TPA: hypothetical protein VGB53_10315 [Rubricoccaceae bacterium]|jgi:hypothetical protein
MLFTLGLDQPGDGPLARDKNCRVAQRSPLDDDLDDGFGRLGDEFASTFDGPLASAATSARPAKAAAALSVRLAVRLARPAISAALRATFRALRRKAGL